MAGIKLEVLRVKIPHRLMARLEIASERETLRLEQRTTKSDIVRQAVQGWLAAHEAAFNAREHLRQVGAAE